MVRLIGKIPRPSPQQISTLTAALKVTHYWLSLFFQTSDTPQNEVAWLLVLTMAVTVAPSKGHGKRLTSHKRTQKSGFATNHNCNVLYIYGYTGVP